MPQLLGTNCGLLHIKYFSRKMLPAGRQRVGTVCLHTVISSLKGSLTAPQVFFLFSPAEMSTQLSLQTYGCIHNPTSPQGAKFQDLSYGIFSRYCLQPLASLLQPFSVSHRFSFSPHPRKVFTSNSMIAAFVGVMFDKANVN